MPHQNKEVRRAWFRNWKKTEKGKESKRKDKISLAGKRRDYKYGAKRRGFSWGINNKQCEFLMKSECYYCGKIPELEDWNGIDRIDASEGYDEKNVVPCCKWCNFSKGTLDDLTFISNCIKIAKRWQNKMK